MIENPTSAEIRALLDYDPLTGILTWRWRPPCEFKDERSFNAWNARYAGMEAGREHPSGYRLMKFRQYRFAAHRLAWIIYYGSLDGDIDHINGVRNDNRISNLRVVDAVGNARNQKLRSTNTSGVTGVCSVDGQWMSYIYVEGKQVKLGKYVSLEEATKVRKTAEREYGFHPNHGRAA
jgi:hypothetical protein